MDQNTQTPNQFPPQAPQPGAPLQPHSEKKVGPIVGALIIIIILVIAALWFFGSKLNTDAPVESAPVVQQNDTQMQASAASADDVNSLQADLDATFTDVEYSF